MRNYAINLIVVTLVVSTIVLSAEAQLKNFNPRRILPPGLPGSGGNSSPINLPSVSVPDIKIPSVSVPTIKVPNFKTLNIDDQIGDLPQVKLPDLNINISKLEGFKFHKEIDLPTLDIKFKDLTLPTTTIDLKYFKKLQEHHGKWMSKGGKHTRKDISVTLKNVDQYLTKKFKEGWEYFQGIQKTIYEREIELSKSNPSVDILALREKEGHCRITITHVSGTDAANIEIKHAGIDETVAKTTLSDGVFKVKTAHPEIYLDLAGSDGSVKLHIKATEFRSTLTDAFAFGGSTSDPDDKKDRRRVTGDNSPTRKEIEKMANAYLSQARGYWFRLFPRGKESEATWFGPFEDKSEAIKNYNAVLEFTEETDRDVPPKYFSRYPGLSPARTDSSAKSATTSISSKSVSESSSALYLVDVFDDSNVDNACEIVGEITVATACTEQVELALIGTIATPPALAAALLVREAACSSDVSQDFTGDMIEYGCSWSVKKTRDTIKFTIKTTKKKANELAAVWQCIESGRCVHWLLVNLR